MKKSQHDAIYSLNSNVARVDDDGQCYDADGNLVSINQTAVYAKAAEFQAAEDAVAYQHQRAPEYPSMATFADAMYWNSTGDSTKLDEYYAACAAVKAKYPKPEVSG